MVKMGHQKNNCINDNRFGPRVIKCYKWWQPRPKVGYNGVFTSHTLPTKKPSSPDQKKPNRIPKWLELNSTKSFWWAVYLMISRNGCIKLTHEHQCKTHGTQKKSSLPIPDLWTLCTVPGLYISLTHRWQIHYLWLSKSKCCQAKSNYGWWNSTTPFPPIFSLETMAWYRFGVG